VNDTAAQYFEPLEAISSSSHVVRLFDFLGTYKLTVTVTIVEQDDPAARKHAKGIIEALGEVVSDAEVKLQQVHQDKPPRGVRIG
jgi:hypothetical protein